MQPPASPETLLPPARQCGRQTALRPGPVDTSTGQLPLRHPGFGLPEDTASEHTRPSTPRLACPQDLLLRSHRLPRGMGSLLQQEPLGCGTSAGCQQAVALEPQAGGTVPQNLTPQGALVCILQRAAMSPGCRREPRGQARDKGRLYRRFAASRAWLCPPGPLPEPYL